MNFLKIFIGSAQSKYAAFAIIIAILAICASILFSNTNISLSQKLTFIFFIIIAISPGILLSLFEITCIVTGSGLKNNNWWCSVLAWIIAIVLIIYSIIIVISVLISLFSFNNAIVKLDEKELNEKTNKNVSIDEANKIAAEHFTTEPARLSFEPPQSQQPPQSDGSNMLGNMFEKGRNMLFGHNEKFTGQPPSEGGNMMESLGG